MTSWAFVEAHITNIEMKHDAPFEDSSWYAQPIQPNLADISACVPPALKKGIMFYFKFGKFSFYKGP